MKLIKPLLLLSILLCFEISSWGQTTTNIDVNLNIEHSVGGVSDFGRERHITVHSNIYENDWIGENEKASYLFNDLDAYLGRDNGTASFLFAYSPADEERLNKHDPDSLTTLLDFWKKEYDRRLDKANLASFKNKTQSMVMGTNPHPTYPTLSYWYPNGSNWGRENGMIWIPQDIETSAEWMVQYMDEFFKKNDTDAGQDLPKYWEVMNEPDFPLNTGQFMMSSWEDIFEYHNLVAQGIKEKMGDNAPDIGGMTWGQHDLFNRDGINRFASLDYVNGYYGTTAVDQVAINYGRSQVDKPSFFLQNEDWYQWDIIWKGFMDTAGENMDFYSLHFYDWPGYNSSGTGVRRSGGHVEATLEMVEWYDVHVNGKENRKPIIVSEYGAVNNAWDFISHDTRYDWESMKPFSSMMMQFLERPDYIKLTMPFTPIKAQWGDNDSAPYHYKLMRDDDGDGNWEWSDFIKWFELWADVEGTRVDTNSSDPDVMVDCYVNGNEAFLILNNLEDEETIVGLNLFDQTNNSIQSIRTKHLFLEGTRDITLTDVTSAEVPESIILNPDATIVLKYTFENNITVDQTSIEKKFYGDAVSPNQRVSIQNGNNRFYVKGVDIPIDSDKAEALLKVTVNLFDAPDNEQGFLSINELTFNGTEITAPLDWRGSQQLRSRWFGTLEIPIPANLITENNTIDIKFQHIGEVCVVNLVTWDFSTTPERTDDIPNAPDPIAVTSISLSPNNIAVDKGNSLQLAATIKPANATNQTVFWSSNNDQMATVDDNGFVTAIAEGVAEITVTTADGNEMDIATITINENSSVVIDPDPTGPTLVIEAEDHINDGGTFDDASSGGPGLGVNTTAVGVNFVNTEDWMEFEFMVATEGVYLIEYLISSPSNDAQVQFILDGQLISTTDVPNNGKWDAYVVLNGGNVNLTEGNHNLRIVASGNNDWQWNLDKINLVKGDDSQLSINSFNRGEAFNEVFISPNPVQSVFTINNLPKLVETFYSIYDLKGNVLSHTITVTNKIDISNFSSGIYFLLIKSQNGSKTLKFIKE